MEDCGNAAFAIRYRPSSILSPRIARLAIPFPASILKGL
jgi:hypothetical protein